MSSCSHCDSADHQHSPQRRGGLGEWLQIVALVVLALFLGYSYFSDRLRFYVAPTYLWLSPMTAVILLAVAAARVRARLRGQVACDCHEHSARIPASVYALVLIAPVALGMAVAPTGFSPEGVRKHRVAPPPRDPALGKAICWVMGERAAQHAAAKHAGGIPKDPTVLDVVRLGETAPVDSLQGEFITLVGQCDLFEGADSPQFDLYRLVVTCCIADASVVSLPVVRAPGVKLEPGGWVRVGGLLKFDDQSGFPVLTLHATAISKIHVPSEPYL